MGRTPADGPTPAGVGYAMESIEVASEHLSNVLQWVGEHSTQFPIPANTPASVDNAGAFALHRPVEFIVICLGQQAS